MTASIGVASGSTRSTTGGSTSRGRSARTAAILSRTSCAFSPTSHSSSNSTNSSDSESLDALRRLRMPSIVLIDSSSTWVTSRSTVSGAAPSRLVVTMTKGNSTRGIEIEAEATRGDHAEQHQTADQHDGEDRPADGGVGERHDGGSGGGADDAHGHAGGDRACRLADDRHLAGGGAGEHLGVRVGDRAHLDR